MQRQLYGLAALPLLASVALAAQPLPLADLQMDIVTAGQAETSGGLSTSPASPVGMASFGLLLFFVNETEVQNTGTVIVSVSGVSCPTCFLAAGPENLVVQSAFGPTK
jgi:hypothetical protein